MGFALPAGIAAGLLSDTRRIVCFTGDGGLGMCLAELETAARLGRDVRVVVFDDATLTLIAIKQGERQGGAEAVRYGAVDFAAVARGLGLRAEKVADSAALEAALAQPGPSLTTVQIDPSAYAAVLAATRA
jgi:acetolactate synthase-1/2/3 large subunit